MRSDQQGLRRQADPQQRQELRRRQNLQWMLKQEGLVQMWEARQRLVRTLALAAVDKECWVAAAADKECWAATAEEEESSAAAAEDEERWTAAATVAVRGGQQWSLWCKEGAATGRQGTSARSAEAGPVRPRASRNPYARNPPPSLKEEEDVSTDI
ncbi:hypothetical protein CRENBAI_007827 [Crenichthys baileyi]|uniref:Uncharacterized protein n=1 Tax=Crenichthys baileyi TaxID=28760 RepID=A0AAV9SEQ8_9TELE